MPTHERSVRIGIFRDRALANHAVKELQVAGFQDDEIRMWAKGAPKSGFLETLKQTLAGPGTETKSISDTLVEMGVPLEDAQYYQREDEAGRTILAVSSSRRPEEASDILYRAGAYTAQTSLTHDLHTVSFLEEVLTPHTQPVEVGALFIRKQVITEERTITVQVQHEEVIVERRPFSTPGAQTPAPEGTIVELAVGEMIRIPLYEEQVVIEKRPIVKEELIIGKQKVQETRHISDTIQREVPHIERDGTVLVHGKADETILPHSES